VEHHRRRLVQFRSVSQHLRLGIAELAPLTRNGSALVVMAIADGTIPPLLEGLLADCVGIHHAFPLPVICYLFTVYYALCSSGPQLCSSRT
jgi:MFS transporter, FHS family, L-fucose permease